MTYKFLHFVSSWIVVAAFATQALANSPAIGGAQSSNPRPVVIDPDFASIAPDQSIAIRNFYGLALKDATKTVARFAPAGSSDSEIAASQERIKKQLENMIRQAKLANKDPSAQKKIFLLVSGNQVQTIEVPKDSPHALQKRISELESQVRELERAQSPAHVDERAAARREYRRMEQSKH